MCLKKEAYSLPYLLKAAKEKLNTQLWKKKPTRVNNTEASPYIFKKKRSISEASLGFRKKLGEKNKS